MQFATLLKFWLHCKKLFKICFGSMQQCRQGPNCFLMVFFHYVVWRFESRVCWWVCDRRGYYAQTNTWAEKIKGLFFSFCTAASLASSTHGLLNIWTELLSIVFSWSAHIRQEIRAQITPRRWIFWTMIFYNLKNSSQDLSNEGSNFILSSLEVGHWVAQT